MKIRSAFPIFVAIGIFATQLLPASAQDKATSQFLLTAINIASHVQSGSMDGYLAVYIAPVTWTAALTDSNLGPFLATQEAMSSRSVTCLYSKKKDTAVCVYFDGTRPYGVAAVKSDAGHQFSAASAAASFQPITPDMLRKPPGKFSLSPQAITLDNGQQLAAFLVKLNAPGRR